MPHFAEVGFFQDWRVPQAWFGHFYVIGILASALTLSLVYRQDGMAQVVIMHTFAFH